MDIYNSTNTNSSNSKTNFKSDTIKISESDPLQVQNVINDKNDLLVLDEDHFNLNADIDYFNDIEYSNLNRNEQLELAISKYRTQLESLDLSDLNKNDKEEKKLQLVRKICDLKIKLIQLKEKVEFEDALKDHQVDDLKNLSDDNPIFFKRIYSFSKYVAGHKLVLSSDIFENEKRLRTTWKNYIKNSSPISSRPSTSLPNDISNSLSISRLLDLLTSNHLSYLTTDYVNWSTNPCQPTNPMQQLVCDHCTKKSTKSLNDYIFDAFKFGKKEELPSTSSSMKLNEIRLSNPYLVCIYCFFTIHYNCLTRIIRKCPKLFFDSMNEEVMSDFYHRLYNYPPRKKYVKQTHRMSCKPVTINKIIEVYHKRMKRIILKICPEIGLSNQDFRCAECRIQISPVQKKCDLKNISKPRLCDYSGLYFCETCHMGDTAIIPARVIHNWDFQPHPVSRASLQIISYLKNKTSHYDRSVLINLVEINPMLYGLVDQLIHIKRLRIELCHMYKYICLCKQPSKPRQWISIVCHIGPHLLNEQEINYLSFYDICDLQSLVKNLSELENLFISHITTCEGCRGKGFYCELCPNKDDILFPFSPNTTMCSLCNAVYHKNCYYRRNQLCSRCDRIKDKITARFENLKDQQEQETIGPKE